jgi:hypothetical protein
MTLFSRIALILLLLVVPAWANAHPGIHVNPHPSNGLLIAVIAAISLGALAWVGMLITLAVLRHKRTQAEDRLIRARLNLAQAQDTLAYWRSQRAYWRAKLYGRAD